MLAICSATFLAANAQQAPTQNPANTTVQNERHVHSGNKEKSIRQETKNIRRDEKLRRHAISNGNKMRAKRLQRNIMRNRSNIHAQRNHFRKGQMNHFHSARTK